MVFILYYYFFVGGLTDAGTCWQSKRNAAVSNQSVFFFAAVKEIQGLCLPQYNHTKFLFDPLGKAAGKILLMV